ncbi:DsbA family protein [Spirosoma gilvum]
MTAKNPLLCDPQTGICEIPVSQIPENTIEPEITQKPVTIIYFTDPICSSCWGIEPALRKLKLAYGHIMEIQYHMGGLLPDWSYSSGGISKPSDVASHWDEVSRYYNMPIDGDVWLEDPLPSSYPPSIAFKAAQIQDPKKAIQFLRRIREMVFLKKKNITKWIYLAEAANEVGLDATRLKNDYDHEANELFNADLTLARSMGVRGFPTLFVTGAMGSTDYVYGVKPYTVFEAAVLKIHPKASKVNYDKDWQALFKVYPTLTTREFSELSDLSVQQSEEELESLTQQGELSKLVTKNGPLWQRKSASY